MFDKLPNKTPIVFANTKAFNKAKRRDKTLFKIETTRASGTIKDKEVNPALHGKILIHLRTHSELRFIERLNNSWAVTAWLPNSQNRPIQTHNQNLKDLYTVPRMYCGTKTVAGNDEWDAYEDIMYIIRNIYPKLCEYGECHY